MKLKPLIVSVSALAVLSIIVFVVRRPEAPASADARVGAPVVEAALIEQATKLRIVDQANTVTLTRGADERPIEYVTSLLNPAFFALHLEF